MKMPRLFVLADSISIQYGPFLRDLLEGHFHYDRKEGLTVAMANLDLMKGANGGDSAMCLTYLEARQRTGGIDADVLLLNCGLHDVKCTPTSRRLQVPIDQYQSNLRRMIDLAGVMRLTLVWVRTTPVNQAGHNGPGEAVWRFNEDIDRYNAVADAVMKQAGIPTIDLHAMTLCLGPVDQTSPDGRHFTTPIQQAHAAYIAGWLIAWRQAGGLATRSE